MTYPTDQHFALYDRSRSRHRWPIFILILMFVAAGVGTPSDIAAIANVIEPMAGLLGIACVVFVIRGANERITIVQATTNG